MADIDNVTVGENNYNLRDSAAQNALPTQGQVDDIITALNTIANKTDHPYNPDNKLPSDYVNDANQTHKFATAAQLAQIETNKNNILLNDVQSGLANLLDFDVDYLKQIQDGSGTWNGNSYTIAGVTFTINSDNSISLSGTANNIAFIRLSYNLNLKKGQYVLSGCPANGGEDKYKLYLGASGLTFNDDIGEGATNTLSNDLTIQYVTFLIRSGQNMTGKTIYPMLYSSEYGTLDYQCHGLSNATITPALKECVDNGAKNLLNVTTIATGNITFTPDADGYVTASPNNTDTRGWTYASAQYKIYLKPATYVCVLDIKTASSAGGLGVSLRNTSNTAIFSSTLPDLQNKTGIVTFTFTITTEGSYGLMIKQYDMVARFMICEKSLYDVSPSYQPYAMSNVGLTNKTNEIGIVKTIVPITPSAANVYECITASKITLPAGKILRISASCIYQNSFATGIAIVRGTTKENSKILGISESTTDYNALSVSTVCSFGSDQDIYVFLQCNSTGTTKLVMSYDIISP